MFDKFESDCLACEFWLIWARKAWKQAKIP